MIYEAKVRASFSAAHNLRNYRGKCENLHGHNWDVEVVFSYEALDDSGMSIDFKIARKILADVLDEFDHKYLNELKVFKKLNPTSENIAKFVYDKIKSKNKNIKAITVWESDKCSATYSED